MIGFPSESSSCAVTAVVSVRLNACSVMRRKELPFYIKPDGPAFRTNVALPVKQLFLKELERNQTFLMAVLVQQISSVAQSKALLTGVLCLERTIG